MMNDGEGAGRRIQGYEPLVSSAIRGKAALVIGGLLVAVACFMTWVAYGDLPSSVDRPNLPPAGFTAVGWCIFGFAGIFLLVLGVRDVGRDARVAREKQFHPNEPWRWDHAWDPRGTRDMGLKQAAKGLVGLAMGAAVIGPVNYVAFAEDMRLFAKIGLGVFDLVLLLGLATVLSRLGREVVHGRSRLEFEPFPLRLGERAKITLLPGRLLGDVQQLTCVVQCVEEAYESRRTHSSGGQRTQQVRVVGNERYRDERTLQGKELDGLRGAGVELSFDLPDAPDLRTRLSDKAPLYWQLEVTGRRPGLDLHKRFLLPVY